MDAVTTTAIDVHRGPNGVLDISEDQPMHSIDDNRGPSMNGVLMEQQQAMQQPALYDMDLERMQTELFKGRYLVPKDFLDDVRKILWNADVRQREDPDRLHKAQAMYTAAEVSIQEFDPQLRQDCERTAARERQRREERRKGKGKERQKEQNGVVVGARRSARNEGLEPEHRITDVGKLERQLKRQRGEEGSGLDSNASELDAHGLPLADGGRNTKRSKLVDEVDDDRDPLDTLASSRPGTEPRVSHSVRFDTGHIEPMAPLRPVVDVQQHFLSPNHHFEQNHQPHYQQPQNIPVPMNNLLHPQNGYHSYNPYDEQRFPDQMAVDTTPQRSSGFDPILLNPMPPPYLVPPFAPRPTNGDPFNFPMSDPTDPFNSEPNPQHYSNQPPTESFTQMLNAPLTPTPPPQKTLPQVHVSHDPLSAMKIDSALEQRRSPLPPVATSTPPPERVATPMVVERTPTPPLPEFHVTESFVSDLRYILKTRTGSLTIEQLEQLRATCLGTIWRQRKEWDRDELVTQLIKEVNEYIDEVAEYDE